MSPMVFNPALALIGLVVVEKRLGRWSVDTGGRLTRHSRVYGHRITTLSEAREMTPSETELGRFMRTRRNP